ncbi:MAG: hypothetical protein HZA50_11785 [Planctomycetes bacterium]|nr:hypothetical protein [Planctomycetota bacterium]
MPEIADMIENSLFHFRRAMNRQKANTPKKVCKSCGRPVDDSLDDCCEPSPKNLPGLPKSASDPDRARELLSRPGVAEAVAEGLVKLNRERQT